MQEVQFVHGSLNENSCLFTPNNTAHKLTLRYGYQSRLPQILNYSQVQS